MSDESIGRDFTMPGNVESEGNREGKNNNFECVAYSLRDVEMLEIIDRKYVSINWT